MAVKRIQKELRDMQINEEIVTGISAGPIEMSDIYHWEATIIGPKDTPYENGIFKLDIQIPKDYPFKPPKVLFKTRIYHCNISKSGTICLDILNDQWTPALNIKNMLLSVSSLLNEPNPKDPLVPEIANLLSLDKLTHDEKARNYTLKYAN